MAEAWTRDLEGALGALAAAVDYPPTPNLASPVRRRIEAAPARRSRWTRLQPAFAVAALALGLTAGVLVFSPSSREAIADWIGLDGVRITFGDADAPIAGDLLLGERVEMAEARDRAGFEIETLDALGAPDEIYIQEDRPGARVSFVYEATDALPRTAETKVGAVFSQFQATEVDVLLKKMTGEARLRSILVDGAQGYWLGGGPHVVAYTRPDGEAGYDQVRLAGNTLLWQTRGVVYRLESALSRSQAIELAESLR